MGLFSGFYGITRDSIFGGNWEVGKRSIFFLLREVDVTFDNNCRECSWCWLYSTSKSWKNLNYKGLRQAGLIIRNKIRDYKLEISFGGFSNGKCLLLNIFITRDVEDAFNPTYLMGCWESNPIQPLFLRRHMVDFYAIQSTWWKCRI